MTPGVRSFVSAGFLVVAAGSPPLAAQMPQMAHDHEMTMPSAREGSGTSWLPDDTPMYAVHREAGPWTLMAHGALFVQYLHESGSRGSNQAGSVNWLMGIADRTVGNGHFALRGMVSLEPWTIRGCGYPDLLASGETCRGDVIHDRQHPHDLFMELTATYDRPVARDIRLQLYGGPVGEPALGPTAFPHRISAMPSPLAPITHHWLDATHIAYGVITGGVYGKRWKAESSVFNGREPDEHRTNLESGALDSWSGRVWFLPTSRWALQASAARLTGAEADVHSTQRIDVNRMTASATYHRMAAAERIWATTIGWGRNQEPGRTATNALLAETNWSPDEHNTWFGRFELSGKSGHDLAAPADDIYTVAKVQAGYTRQLTRVAGVRPGVGVGVSAGVVPSSLSPVYGNRVNWGFGIFFTLRPAASNPSIH